MKVILITESQYKRLFLEQGSADIYVDNYAMGLVDKYEGRPYGSTMRDYKKHQRDSAAKFWNDYKHEILDVVAIAVLFIPVAGPFISMGVELANAGLYFAEGDELMGGLSALLAVVPGGMVARRMLKKSGIVKQIDDVTKWLMNQQKLGKEVTKDQLEKKLKKEIGETTVERNKDLIVNYFDEVLPSLGKQNAKKHAAKLQKLINLTQGYWKDFIANEKVFKKFLKANGDSTYKAYIAYLLSISRKEAFWGSVIYALLMVFGEDIVTFTIEKSPFLQKQIINWKKSRLKDDAEKGNISSIVRNDGYPWKETKEIFMSDGSPEENTLLKGAWEAGWRPDSGKYVPEKFRTEKYKKFIDSELGGIENFDPNDESLQNIMDKYQNIDQNKLDSMLSI